MYATPGTFDVSLKITTQGGCTAQVNVPGAVRAGNLPVSDFTFTPPATTCAGDSVHFFDQSTPSAIVDRWDWNFGDGSTSDVKDPVHQFEAMGDLPVQLTAYSNGCRSTTTKSITIHRDGPVAKFKPQVDCSKPGASRLTVTFVDQSIVSNPAAATYSWDFGPSASTQFWSTPTPPAITYPAQGKYPVKLVVSEGACTYTLVKNVDLTAEVANFKVTKPTACRYEPIRFETVGIDTGQIASYQWQIGSGPVFNGNWHIDTLFNNISPLNQQVSLIVTDTFGCVSGPFKVPFSVAGTDVALSVATGGCVKNKIVITDASAASGTITNWAINYGDGNFVNYTAPPFSHQYTDSGVYIIRMFTTNNFGCKDYRRHFACP